MSQFDQPRAVVGVSAFGHDAAAALVRTGRGEVLAATAEERLSGRKHDSHFPVGAVASMLAIARRLEVEVEAVAVAHEPEAFIAEALPRQLDRLPAGAGPRPDGQAELIRHFRSSSQLVDDEWTPERIPDLPPCARDGSHRHSATIRWYYEWALFHQYVANVAGRMCGVRPTTVPHHLAHAAAAYFGAAADTATIVTIDGQGEADTAAVFLASKGRLERVATSWWPNSLGALYLAVTAHLGFALGDEGIVMGMSAYGEPRYASAFLDAMAVSDAAVVSFAAGDVLDIRWSDDFPYTIVALGDRLTRVVPRRAKGAPLESRHFDLAASLQRALERVGVDLVRKAIALTGCPTVALAGGVCLNACMNQQIRRQSGCRDLFVFPASGDDGTAVGAALYIARRSPDPPPAGFNCFLGYVGDAAATDTLERRGVRYRRSPRVVEELAVALARGEIVARIAGPAEFGPRALGHRSILADPRDPATRDRLNERIKRREMFRPFAPVCPLDDVKRFFDATHGCPHMTEVVEASASGRACLGAAVHVDGTARLQTVTRDSDPLLYDLLKAFERLSGVPVLVNTSFNVSGEPLVHSLDDALDSFLLLAIDLLWMEEDVVISRRDNGHLRAPASLTELLSSRRARNSNVLDPRVDIDLSTDAAIRRFRRPGLRPW